MSEWDDLSLVRALVHDLRHCGGKLANASDANRKVAGKAAGELAVLALNAADCISYLSVTILALGKERENYKAALLEELAPPPLPDDEEQFGDLLSCPFCGGMPASVDIDEGENAGGSCVECTECGASSNLDFGRKENFRSNWNRRVTSRFRDGANIHGIGPDTADGLNPDYREPELSNEEAKAAIEAWAGPMPRFTATGGGDRR